jgi:NAD(P)-dependent dehydrogenase (short-subunit alcohol dehydrogenase family)
MTSNNKLFDLSGRVAWVVGGGGYLGRPVSRLLAELGAKVCIGDSRAEAASAACDALRQEGLNADAMTVDVADETAVRDAVGRIHAQYGRLDVAVNATTYSTGASLMEITAADWEKGLRVTLVGAFLVARESARIMLPQGKGSIIHFGSMYGLVSPDPNMYTGAFGVNPIDYGAAKAGIHQMVRYQAVMWGPQGVRVNAVVPGPFPNPAGQGDHTEFVSRQNRKTALGRVGRADEIAGAVAFLASDASSYMTGAQIVVDGGWTAW